MPRNYPDIESFLSWSRYLSWADLHRKRFDAYFEEEGDKETPGHIGRFITFTSLWFASLWVVAEGFIDLQCSDNHIISILNNPPGHAELLRRCRNGVYHYQKSIEAERLVRLLKVERPVIAWSHALHSEFLRWFWQYPEHSGLNFEEAEEWRNVVSDLLGWLPNDTPYVKITELERQIRLAEKLVPPSDDCSAAEEVRAATEHARILIKKLKRDLLRRQQKYQDAGWLVGFPSSV